MQTRAHFFRLLCKQKTRIKEYLAYQYVYKKIAKLLKSSHLLIFYKSQSGYNENCYLIVNAL